MDIQYMKSYWIFLFGVILSMQVFAQNYSANVSLVQQDGNNVTLLATATGDKKKEAAEEAVESAFSALFHVGVSGLKNGIPMVSVARKDFDYIFFSERQHLSYMVNEVETVESKKISGRYRVTVQVCINVKALSAELQRNHLALNPNWVDSKAVKATAALNPTIVIVPYTTADDGYRFEAMLKKVERNRLDRYVIDRISQEFQHHGYKTRDFISQLQNSKNMSLLRMEAQTDDATMLVQQLPGDIEVKTEVTVNTDVRNNSECTLTLRAVEKQTDGKLATASFSSGKYMTTDSLKLAEYAIKKIQDDFFSQLQASFEDIVKNGREVFVEIGLSQAVSDWDFEQDSPATGDYFKDTLDEWLREHAFQGVYDMNGTDKFVNIRLNIPLWNMEKNRSYTLSNFASELRNFFKGQLGDDYKASTVAMGQKLVVTIE